MCDLTIDEIGLLSVSGVGSENVVFVAAPTVFGLFFFGLCLVSVSLACPHVLSICLYQGLRAKK